jgi:hypothetical protein
MGLRSIGAPGKSAFGGIAGCEAKASDEMTARRTAMGRHFIGLGN